ncbi:DNA gyrase C-terminal beta-propeller domain-containing protein, partial [Streptococcus sobrinus]
TEKGYALHFSIEEVPVVGSKAAGVKAINLKDGDTVQSAFIANTKSFFILTQRGSLKRMALDDIPLAKRAGRGLQVLRELKSKPHRVFLAGPVLSDANTQDLDLFSTEVQESDDQQILEVMSKTGKLEQVNLVELGLSERTSNGSFISDTISDQEIYRAEVK